MKYILIFLPMAIYLSSCDNTDGKQKDTIGLSTKNLYFEASGGSETIVCKGENWEIIYAYDDNKYFAPEQNESKITGEYFLIERTEGKNLFVALDKNHKDHIRVLKIKIQDANYYDEIIVKQKSAQSYKK